MLSPARVATFGSLFAKMIGGTYSDTEQRPLTDAHDQIPDLG